MKAIVSEERIEVFLKGGVFVFFRENESFDQILEAVKTNNSDLINRMIVTENAVFEWSAGKFTYHDKQLKYKGDPVPQAIKNRVIWSIKNGVPVDYLLKFYRKLNKNPSANSVNQLMKFLESNSIAIDDEGYIIALKAVREDWTDIFSGKISNRVGNRVTIPRNKVDDNPRKGCSFGLHAGSKEYVSGYAPSNRGYRYVYVRIHPKDVVSVPNDHSFGKVRVCEYVVIGVASGDLSPVMSDMSSVIESNPDGTLLERWTPDY